MGGVAASAYGATRPTTDFDCVVRRAAENLDRLAAALRELNARLRVDRLPDDEAAALPFRIDTQTLLHSEIWTLRTDAGDVDVDVPDRQGHRRRYEDLIGAATTTQRSGQVLRLAALAEIIASKEWADRPKDHEALPGCAASWLSSPTRRWSAAGRIWALSSGSESGGRSTPAAAERPRPRAALWPSRSSIDRVETPPVLDSNCSIPRRSREHPADGS